MSDVSAKVFWKLQVGVGAAGIAAFMVLGPTGAACTHPSAASTCPASVTSTSTSTDTSLGTVPPTCQHTDTMTSTATEVCPPDPATIAYLQQLAAQSSSVVALEFAAYAPPTCPPAPAGATVSDPARARAVLAALVANATPDTSCPHSSPTGCGATYTLKFLSSPTSVVAEVDIAFDTSPEAIIPDRAGFSLGEPFYAALASALGVQESAIYPSCCG